jgi:hypothetical protein
MRENLGRAAVAVRWLSLFWPVGAAVYAVFGAESYVNTGAMLTRVAWVIVPACVLFFAAWVMQDFARKLPPDD